MPIGSLWISLWNIVRALGLAFVIVSAVSPSNSASHLGSTYPSTNLIRRSLFSLFWSARNRKQIPPSSLAYQLGLEIFPSRTLYNGSSSNPLPDLEIAKPNRQSEERSVLEEDRLEFSWGLITSQQHRILDKKNLVRRSPIGLKVETSGGEIVFSSFLGSSIQDRVHAVEVDKAGNIFLGGVGEIEFPPGQKENGTFIAKLSPLGETEYVTFLGGGGYWLDIAVDTVGSVYVTGEAFDSLVTTPGAYDPTHNGQGDAFVTKLASDGTLVYSTFLGSEATEQALGIDVDLHGNAYIVGIAGSGFPTTPNAFDPIGTGSVDVFVAKFDPTGSQLLYSTFLGGSSVARRFHPV